MTTKTTTSASELKFSPDHSLCLLPTYSRAATYFSLSLGLSVAFLASSHTRRTPPLRLRRMKGQGKRRASGASERAAREGWGAGQTDRAARSDGKGGVACARVGSGAADGGAIAQLCRRRTGCVSAANVGEK